MPRRRGALDSDREPWVAVDLELLVSPQVHLTFPTGGPHRFVVQAGRDRATWTVIADRSGQEVRGGPRVTPPPLRA